MSQHRLRSNLHQKRSVARLAVVQALYQIMISDASLTQAKEYCIEHGTLIDDPAEMNVSFFNDLLDRYVQNREAIDTIIRENLDSDWSFERLDPVVVNVLRAGICELITDPALPGPIIINEYVDIAAAFYQTSEPHFINKCLHVVCSKIRLES